MKLEDLAESLPPELAARLDDIVEVAPGQKKRLGDTSPDDAVGWLEATNEASMNHGEIMELMARAAAENVAVPAAVLDRLGRLRRGDGPQFIELRNELRALFRTAVD